MVYIVALICAVVAVLSFFTGCAGLGNNGVPSIVVHQYNYEAKPVASPPGMPPLPPKKPIKESDLPSPPVVNYKTTYESALDDPTLVVFVNRSYRVIRIQIGDEPEIRLEPYQATANLHFAPGEYRVRKTIERPVKIGLKPTVFDWVTFLNINVALNGRSQIIYLSEN